MTKTLGQFMKLGSWILALYLVSVLMVDAGGQSDIPKLRSGEPVLFLDDSMIAAKSGVERHFHEAIKDSNNPLLTPDRDWEMETAIHGTVIYDRNDRLFKMWYSSIIVGADASNTMYATSEDGLHWNRPALNLFEVPNRKVDNNIALASRPGLRHEIQTVLFEPDDKPDKQYKLLFGSDRLSDSEQGDYHIWYSPDGIHFHAGEKFGVPIAITGSASSTSTTALPASSLFTPSWHGAWMASSGSVIASLLSRWGRPVSGIAS